VEHINKEILVLAGMVAVQQWNIDPAKKIDVIFVDSLKPLRIQKPIEIQAGDEEASPHPPFDDLVFGNHYRKGNLDFWLAWGPITRTLAIFANVDLP
jgi:hypothetical protein